MGKKYVFIDIMNKKNYIEALFQTFQVRVYGFNREVTTLAVFTHPGDSFDVFETNLKKATISRYSDNRIGRGKTLKLFYI